MPVSFIVKVKKTGPKTEQRLSEYALVRHRLYSDNAYILEVTPKGRTHEEVTREYKDFISELKKQNYVTDVKLLEGPLVYLASCDPYGRECPHVKQLEERVEFIARTRRSEKARRMKEFQEILSPEWNRSTEGVLKRAKTAMKL